MVVKKLKCFVKTIRCDKGFILHSISKKLNPQINIPILQDIARLCGTGSGAWF